jgi:hypothetical protein
VIHYLKNRRIPTEKCLLAITKFVAITIENAIYNLKFLFFRLGRASENPVRHRGLRGHHDEEQRRARIKSKIFIGNQTKSS